MKRATPIILTCVLIAAGSWVYDATRPQERVLQAPSKAAIRKSPYEIAYWLAIMPYADELASRHGREKASIVARELSDVPLDQLEEGFRIHMTSHGGVFGYFEAHDQMLTVSVLLYETSDGKDSSLAQERARLVSKVEPYVNPLTFLRAIDERFDRRAFSRPGREIQ